MMLVTDATIAAEAAASDTSPQRLAADSHRLNLAISARAVHPSNANNFTFGTPYDAFQGTGAGVGIFAQCEELEFKPNVNVNVRMQDVTGV